MLQYSARIRNGAFGLLLLAFVCTSATPVLATHCEEFYEECVEQCYGLSQCISRYECAAGVHICGCFNPHQC
jgi:hypothetical protein